jgi:RNA polymerase sigma-70 factor, ECF subfamily
MATLKSEALSQNEITQILLALNKGEQNVIDELFVKLEPALRRIARQYMYRERMSHTLQPTALINEAYLKLVNEKFIAASNRTEFLAVISNVMRRILVDHARHRNAVKRGGGNRVELDEKIAAPQKAFLDLLSLNDALDELKRFDETGCRIVELRFFAGLTNEEIAGVLNVTVRTVIRKWMMARDWLFKKLG